MADNAQSILRLVPRYLFQGQNDSTGQTGPTLQKLADRANFERSKRELAENVFETVSPLGMYSGEAEGALLFGKQISKELNKNLAAKMAREGATQREIYKATGLVAPMNYSFAVAEPMGIHGRGRILSPEDAARNAGVLSRYNQVLPTAVRAGDIMDFPEFFARVPKAKNTPVILNKAPSDLGFRSSDQAVGYFTPHEKPFSKGHIWLEEDPRTTYRFDNWNRHGSGSDISNRYNLLEHEMTHALQSAEKYPQSWKDAPWEKRIDEITASIGGMADENMMPGALDTIKRLLGEYYPDIKSRYVKSIPNLPAKARPLSNASNKAELDYFNSLDEQGIRDVMNMKRGGLVQMKECNCGR